MEEAPPKPAITWRGWFMSASTTTLEVCADDARAVSKAAPSKIAWWMNAWRFKRLSIAVAEGFCKPEDRRKGFTLPGAGLDGHRRADLERDRQTI